MAQAPAYTRAKNFAANPGNNTDNGAINTELDKIAAWFYLLTRPT